MPNVYDEDPYKILGIPPTATAEDAKQAYHKLARENHPDLNKDARAAERMKEINRANEILSDPQERAAYDQWKASAFQSTDFTGPYTYRGYKRPSQPYTTYQTGPTVRKVRMVGCSAGPLIWILATIVLSILRGIRPLAQSNFNYSIEDPATQAFMMEQLDTALETLHATRDLSIRNASAA